MRRVRFSLIMLSACALIIGSVAATVTLELHDVARAHGTYQIGVNQPFRAQIRATVPDRNYALELEGRENFVVHGTRSSQSVVINASKMEMTLSQEMRLMPRQTGVFELRAAANNGGEYRASQVIKLEVTEENVAQATRQASRSEPTIVATLSSRVQQAVVGQPIEVFLSFKADPGTGKAHIHFGHNDDVTMHVIDDPSRRFAPSDSAQGATSNRQNEADEGHPEPPSGESKDQYPVQEASNERDVAEGDDVRTLEELMAIVIPTQEGELQLPGVTITYQVPREHDFGGMQGFDNQFFSSFFNRPSQRQAVSNGLTVKVAPLPSEAKGVQGVGQFWAFDAQLDAHEVQANKPLTLTLTLHGRGNFEQIDPPQLDLPEGVRVYPATMRLKHDLKTREWSGTQVFEYVLQPLQQGKLHIPKQTFSFYDPEAGAVKQMHTDALEVRVAVSFDTAGKLPAQDDPSSSLRPEGSADQTEDDPSTRLLTQSAQDELSSPSTELRVNHAEPPSGVSKHRIFPLKTNYTPALPNTHWPWFLILIMSLVLLFKVIPLQISTFRALLRRTVSFFSFGWSRYARRRKELRSLERDSNIIGLYTFFVEVIAQACGIEAATLSYDDIYQLLGEQDDWDASAIKQARDFIKIVHDLSYAGHDPDERAIKKAFKRAHTLLPYFLKLKILRGQS